MAHDETPAPVRTLCALIESHERERAQWVREVQHEMAQTLTGLRCHLQMIQRSGDAAAVERAEQAGALVDTLVQWLRELANRVRPPMLDDLGLGPTLSWYANHLERETGKRVHLGLQGLDERLAYLVETAGYRVAAALLPAWLSEDAVMAVHVHVAVQDSALWLFVSSEEPVAAAGPASQALAGLGEWVAWMDGSVRMSHETEGTHAIVMVPAVSTDRTVSTDAGA